MKRALLVLLVLCGVADAQPVITWRPPMNCATNDFLKWNGSAWVCSAGAALTGTGTADTLTKWTSASTLGNSGFPIVETTATDRMTIGNNATSDQVTVTSRIVNNTASADGASTYGFVIRGTGGAGSAPQAGSLLTLENAGSDIILGLSSSTNLKRIVFGNSSGQQDGYLDYDSIARGMQFRTAGSIRVSLDSSGNLGVADTSPDNRLTVSGAASATSGFYTNEARTIGFNESGTTLQFRTNNLDAQMTLDSSANLALKGNATLGDNATVDTVLVNGFTTIRTGASASTAAASTAATVLELGQVDSTNNYLTFRTVSAQAGFRFNNSSGEGDGFFVYGSGRNFLWGTGGVVRAELDVNGRVFYGDTTNTAVASDVDVVTVGNTGTGQSTDGTSVVKVTHTGSITTASGNRTYYGGNYAVSATESAGGNVLKGVALRASATGGDEPTAFWADDGDTLIDDKLYVANEGVTVSSCGSGASVSGNELAGVITPGTGAPTSCTLNFTVSYRGSYPSCVAMLEGINGDININASGGGGITTALVTFTTANTLAGDKRIHYHCMGRP